MPVPDRIDDHVAPALALLTDAFRGKPVTEGILKSLVAPKNALESAVWDVLWGRVLGVAEGHQLDVLGKIVGESRRGRDDTNYEAAIRLRARVNRSQGRASDVLDVAVLFDDSATYLEYRVFAWEVSIYNITTAPEVLDLLRQAKAAASYGVLTCSQWPEANVFKFSHAGASAGANVLASAHGTSIDKRMPAALPTSPPYIRYAS